MPNPIDILKNLSKSQPAPNPTPTSVAELLGLRLHRRDEMARNLSKQRGAGTTFQTGATPEDVAEIDEDPYVGKAAMGAQHATEAAHQKAISQGYGGSTDIATKRVMQGPDDRIGQVTGAGNIGDGLSPVQRQARSAQASDDYKLQLPLMVEREKGDQDRKTRSQNAELLKALQGGNGGNMRYGMSNGEITASQDPNAIQDIDAAAMAVLSNPDAIKDFPQQQRSKIYQHINQSGGQIKSRKDQLVKEVIDGGLNTVRELRNHPGKASAVGFPATPARGFGLTDLFGMKSVPGSPVRDFDNKLEQLKSQASLSRLPLMQGLGHMSDIEFGTVSKSLTSLDRSGTPEAFESELNNLEKVFQEIVNRRGALPPGPTAPPPGAPATPPPSIAAPPPAPRQSGRFERVQD